MTQISLAAAFDSVLIAELPGMQQDEAQTLLAENKFQGSLQALEHMEGFKEAGSPFQVSLQPFLILNLPHHPQYQAELEAKTIRDGPFDPSQPPPEKCTLLQDHAAQPRWFALCQHKQLSVAEIDILAAHNQAAEEADEDFLDNMS